MSSRRLKVLLGALVLIGGGVLVWTQLPRDSTDRTSVGSAVQAFNQDLPDGIETEKRLEGLPRFGVYRYTTRGGESIDTAVLSSAHKYDGISTIAIEPSPCGIDERWQVFSTRWSKDRVCQAEPGTRLDALSEYREFFGSGQRFSYRCHGRSIPPFSKLTAGMTWHTRCASKDGSLSNRARVLGVVRTRAAGRSRKAIEVRATGVLRGQNEGTTARTEWLRPSDGLVLRRTVSTKTSFDFVGGGSYNERYTLTLVSTSPLG